MLEALPVGTLSRQLADTVPEAELLTIEGYPKILKLILQAHQAYLEAELEKATLDFMYPRAMEKTELYTTYVAYLELLGRELDQQLHPAAPIDERIKAVVLLKHCILDKEQRTQLALKRAGTQPFQKVADLLRTLDRHEAFLHQAAATPAVRKSYPVARDGAPSYDLEAPAAAGLKELVIETVQELVPPSTPAVDPCPRCDGENPHCTFLRSEEEVDEYESNDDFDSEGQLKLDFEDDKEYPEEET